MLDMFKEYNEAVGNRKTGGYVHGTNVDMYTKRSGSRERVFRVKWYERNSAYPTHEAFEKALHRESMLAAKGYGCKIISEWVEKNQTFPYSPDGLEAAIKFDKSLEPMYEKFLNREE